MTLFMEQRSEGSSFPLPPREALPETPPPAHEQAANLPFVDALRCFRAQHSRPVNARDGVLEAALLIDMRLEAEREARKRALVHASAIEFTAWARQRRPLPEFTVVMERFRVSRATAYRWLAGYKRALGMA
jgi:hypothetical protein